MMGDEALHEIISLPIELRAQLRELTALDLENTDPDVAVLIADQRKNVMAQLDAIWIQVFLIDGVMPGFAQCYSDIMVRLIGGVDGLPQRKK
jgi:hypothetical protein